MKLEYTSFRKVITILLSSFLYLFFIPSAYSASSDEWRCNSYAQDAAEQNRQNRSASCGFTGLRWNNDKEGQKQWCLTVRRGITAKEHRIRKNMLENCFVRKSARTNPENQPNIPRACKDPSNIYLPVRNIYSGYRYEKTLYKPVGRNGLIKHDFSGDSQSDYLFIEQSRNNDVRLVSCFSNTQNGYQRQLTDMHFYTNSGSLSSEQYSISTRNGLLNIEINSFAHNEGSCFTSGFYTFNRKKQRFEVIDSKSDCSPVIDSSGQPYPIYPPQLPKMFR